MTSDGKLEHEGSMSPREPGKPRTSVPQGLVLDIFGLAPQSGKTIPLVLRKIDERRKSTQTWRFTEVTCVGFFSCLSLLIATVCLSV